jgi:hypothetical protein
LPYILQKEEGRRKKEEGRRKKEEGRGKREFKQQLTVNS